MNRKKLQKKNPYTNQVIKCQKILSKVILCGMATGMIVIPTTLGITQTVRMEETKRKISNLEVFVENSQNDQKQAECQLNQVKEQFVQMKRQMQQTEEQLIEVEQQLGELEKQSKQMEKLIEQAEQQIAVKEANMAEKSTLMESEEARYIKLYSDIYCLNDEMVYSIIANLTSNFTDENYLNHYIIGESKMKGITVSCTSKEEAILLAVRSISQVPEKYGYQLEELKTKLEYKSELDYSHQIAYASNVVGIDAALNYAICKAECGFSSTMFLSQNNPSGIKFSGKYASFPSPMAGFIEQALELLKHQLNNRTTIEEIGSVHAPVSDPVNAGWVSNVTSIYKNAMDHYDELFSFESNEKVLILQ